MQCLCLFVLIASIRSFIQAGTSQPYSSAIFVLCSALEFSTQEVTSAILAYFGVVLRLFSIDYSSYFILNTVLFTGFVFSQVLRPVLAKTRPAISSCVLRRDCRLSSRFRRFWCSLVDFLSYQVIKSQLEHRLLFFRSFFRRLWILFGRFSSTSRSSSLVSTM